LPLPDLPKVVEYAAEALMEDSKLDLPATVKSNTLRVVPQTQETEREVSLEALPGKIQGHQWPADSYGDPCADSCVRANA
jgi:hypothetical protein